MSDLSSVESSDPEHVLELEARVAELERELADTRNANVHATTTIGRSDERADDLGTGVFAVSGGEVGVADSRSAEDSVDTSAPASGARVSLTLHESRGSDVPVPMVSERLPVAPMPPIAFAPVAAPTSTPAPLPSPARAGEPPAPHASGGVPATFGGAPVAPVPIPVAAAPNVAAQPPVARAPQSDELVDYRAALADLTARRYEAAIGALSAFLRDHPGSAQADDALYWRATAYYALRRYREASVDYDRVVRIAPRGDRAADALYHSALCARRLGDDEQARASFARVQRDYPNSVAARLAAREDTT